MTTRQLCIDYLDALNRGSLEDVRSLFTEDAKVVSPLYGEGPAFTFYRDLFADTSRSETTLLNVFEATDGGASVALHFQYLWTLSDGKKVSFECVDVFTLSQTRDRFEKLTIIYDTARLRGNFESLKRG